MEAILALDRHIFLLINHLPHSLLLDEIAKFFSGIGTWGVVWVVIAVVLFFREETRDHWFFVPTIFVSLGVVISEFIFKALVARPRPTIDMGAIMVGHADNFSFPSSHATIAFAFAYILSEEEPRWKFWFYLLAVFISLSRIYLGVHYPLDVVGGALLGWGIGSIAEKIVPHRGSKKTQR